MPISQFHLQKRMKPWFIYLHVHISWHRSKLVEQLKMLIEWTFCNKLFNQLYLNICKVNHVYFRKALIDIHKHSVSIPFIHYHLSIDSFICNLQKSGYWISVECNQASRVGSTDQYSIQVVIGAELKDDVSLSLLDMNFGVLILHRTERFFVSIRDHLDESLQDTYTSDYRVITHIIIVDIRYNIRHPLISVPVYVMLKHVSRLPQNLSTE